MTETKVLEYNSQRENLVISEYGRHVKKLLDHAKTIADKEERQKFVEGVIVLMHQMNPHHKNIVEVQERLWKHAYRISNFELDVDPPEGVVLTKADVELQPERVAYPKNLRKYRHYGSYIQEMIEKALALEDPDKKKEFLSLIASYMKMAYKTWSKNHYSNDEMIKADLTSMTSGKYEEINSLNLDLLKAAYAFSNTKSSSGKGKGDSKRGRSHSDSRSSKKNMHKKRRRK